MSQKTDQFIHLKILSPEKEFYNGNILSITLQTFLGTIEILPLHVSLVSIIFPGYITIKREGEDPLSFFVTDGYLNVNNSITIIADQILPSADVTKEFIEKQGQYYSQKLIDLSTCSDKEFQQSTDYIALYNHYALALS